MCAVPLTYNSLHALVVEPKSNASFTSGMNEDDISAPNETKSVDASPTLIFPPKFIFPAMSASPVSLRFEPVISHSESNLPTVAVEVTPKVPPIVWFPVTVTVPPVMLVMFAFVPVSEVIVTLEIELSSMLPVKSILSLPTPSLFNIYNDSSPDA